MFAHNNYRKGDTVLITKTDYLAYKQCPKSFWLRKHQKDVLTKAPERNNATNMLKDELIENTFPSGTWILSEDLIDRVQETKYALDEGTSILYGATFEYDNMVVIIDAAIEGIYGWELYKVTTATTVKERHIDDLAFQYFVAQQNIPVNNLHVTYMNRDYIRKGPISYRDLVMISNVTDSVADKQRTLIREMDEMTEILQASSCDRSIGNHCSKYGKEEVVCPAKIHCWSRVPEYSVFNIARIGNKALELYQDGIVQLEEITDDIKLTANQRAQVDMYTKREVKVDIPSIKEFLSDFTYPLYFLDFETYQSVIPLYDNVSPYQQLPFQYSLHILSSSDASLEHKEFLAKEGTDARRLLAERLVQDIPADVKVVAYNMSFEKRVISELADQFPDLADHLLAIHDNMLDIMAPFQKKWYQSYLMKGKYSIKYVLPALFPDDPELDYKTLDIQNGTMAMDVFAHLHTYPPNKIQELRKALLAYCKLDTLAMVKIWEKLSTL
ncbi:phosphomethylpyrimidine kinase [Priestia megaterium]|nr:phosphomethylpyrimidine kinase [Priestia megaterium]